MPRTSPAEARTFASSQWRAVPEAHRIAEAPRPPLNRRDADEAIGAPGVGGGVKLYRAHPRPTMGGGSAGERREVRGNGGGASAESRSEMGAPGSDLRGTLVPHSDRGTALHWCRAGTALAWHHPGTTRGYCTGTALALLLLLPCEYDRNSARNIRVLNWCFSGAALVPHEKCSGMQLATHRYYTGTFLFTTLLLYWYSRGSVPGFHVHCVDTALARHSNCTGA